MISPSKRSYKALIISTARSLTERAVYKFSNGISDLFNDYRSIVSTFDTYKRHYSLISEGYIDTDKPEVQAEIADLAFKNTVLDDLLSELYRMMRRTK